MGEAPFRQFVEGRPRVVEPTFTAVDPSERGAPRGERRVSLGVGFDRRLHLKQPALMPAELKYDDPIRLRGDLGFIGLQFREYLTRQTFGLLEPTVHPRLQRVMAARPPVDDSELAQESVLLIDGPVEAGPVTQN